MSGPDGLFADGRGLSDLLQGVTLEIFGEGESMGPLNDDMRAEELREQRDIKYDINWHTLNEGLAGSRSGAIPLPSAANSAPCKWGCTKSWPAVAMPR